MRANVVEISSKSIRFSAPDLNTKNAWAQLVRRRFYGQNLVKQCMAEWHLTDGQARGLVYAQATQNTIDAILKRDPIKGFGLSIEIAAIVTGVELEDYIDHKAREAARERTQWEATERDLASLRAAVGDRRNHSGRGA